MLDDYHRAMAVIRCLELPLETRSLPLMRYENEVTSVLYWVSLPVSLRRQSLTRPLGPDVVGTKIKIREYPVDGQRLSYRLQSSRPQVIVPKAEPREGGVEGKRLSDRPPRPGPQPNHLPPLQHHCPGKPWSIRWAP